MPGRIYVDIVTVNGIDIYAVLVDPNGVLSAPIGSIATLKTGPQIWVNANGAMVWDQVYPAVAPPSSSTAVLTFGSDQVSNTVTTRWLSPWFDNVIAQTGPIRYRIPRAGTIRNMRVHVNAPAGNGNLIVYTLRVNGVATALSVSLASTGADGSDLVDSVVVAAGDLVDLMVTKALDVGVTPQDIVASFEFA